MIIFQTKTLIIASDQSELQEEVWVIDQGQFHASFVKSLGEFMVYKEFSYDLREDCHEAGHAVLLRDFQDFPYRLVLKNVALKRTECRTTYFAM